MGTKVLDSVKAAVTVALSLGTVEGGTLGAAGLVTGREACVVALMTALVATVTLVSSARKTYLAMQLGRRIEARAVRRRGRQRVGTP